MIICQLQCTKPTEAGRHLGYVARINNEALAHLMDAGKLLFALPGSGRMAWHLAETR
jgi:hypothetical protein